MLLKFAEFDYLKNPDNLKLANANISEMQFITVVFNNAVVKTWLTSENCILPAFDGKKYDEPIFKERVLESATMSHDTSIITGRQNKNNKCLQYLNFGRP